jgi:hypothetical protein
MIMLITKTHAKDEAFEAYKSVPSNVYPIDLLTVGVCADALKDDLDEY